MAIGDSGGQQAAAMKKAASKIEIIYHCKPDQGWAWVICLSCACINAIVFGVYRSYGFIFVEILHHYNVSRALASWPFSLCMTITHLSGPIAGSLTSHYTTRKIVFIGLLIASIGPILCFMATSIAQIIFFIGIIQGFGVGLSFMQTHVIILQYFNKYKARATAIAFVGGTVGSFIFPPVLQYLLGEFGLHGCFLLIGGIILNALPFALLLRPAKPSKGVKLILEDLSGRKRKTRYRNLNTYKLVKPISYFDEVRCTCFDHRSFGDKIFSKDIKLDYFQNSCSEARKELLQFEESRFFLRLDTCLCIKKQKEYENNFNFLARLKENEKKKAIKTNTQNEKRKLDQLKSVLRNHFKLILSVLRNPLFVNLSITHVSFQWGWLTYMMVIVDFAVDLGLSKSQGVTLLSSFAVADLLGRLTSGWLTDKDLVRKRNLVSCCILLIGVILWLTTACKTFRILLIMTIAFGFVCGVIIVNFSVLTMEYVGIDKLPIALGTSAFLVGLTTTMRPVIVGLFRDNLNSYNGLFQFVGGISLLAALLWLSEPIAHLWVKRHRSNKLKLRPDIVK